MDTENDKDEMDTQNDKDELERQRREAEERARNFRCTRQTFVTGSSLVSLQANEEGWVAVIPYDGAPYDTATYRVEKGGWDHQHCYTCLLRIDDGDTWWVAAPHNEVGLCEECHARLFGDPPIQLEKGPK